MVRFHYIHGTSKMKKFFKFLSKNMSICVFWNKFVYVYFRFSEDF